MVWTNTAAATDHTSTHDFNDPLVWDSGSISPGGTFQFAFNVAGKFQYHCEIHPSMTGTVSVAPKATPSSGPAGTQFTILVARSNATGTLLYDIQKKDPGGAFEDWMIGVTLGRDIFDSTSEPPGTYQFRVRLRDTTYGFASGYSMAVAITVTSME